MCRKFVVKLHIKLLIDNVLNGLNLLAVYIVIYLLI
jgi:hypothetical protein